MYDGLARVLSVATSLLGLGYFQEGVGRLLMTVLNEFQVHGREVKELTLVCTNAAL